MHVTSCSKNAEKTRDISYSDSINCTYLHVCMCVLTWKVKYVCVELGSYVSVCICAFGTCVCVCVSLLRTYMLAEIWRQQIATVIISTVIITLLLCIILLLLIIIIFIIYDYYVLQCNNGGSG